MAVKTQPFKSPQGILTPPPQMAPKPPPGLKPMPNTAAAPMPNNMQARPMPQAQPGQPQRISAGVYRMPDGSLQRGQGGAAPRMPRAMPPKAPPGMGYGGAMPSAGSQFMPLQPPPGQGYGGAFNPPGGFQPLGMPQQSAYSPGPLQDYGNPMMYAGGNPNFNEYQGPVPNFQMSQGSPIEMRPQMSRPSPIEFPGQPGTIPTGPLYGQLRR